MRKILFGSLLAIVGTSALAQRTGPAPPGEAKAVAIRAIADAAHPCPKVKSATRNSDGSVSAVCSNKEDYRIFTANSKVLVMRCRVVRKMGIKGC
jgi:hypothetical protein